MISLVAIKKENEVSNYLSYYNRKRKKFVIVFFIERKNLYFSVLKFYTLSI